MARLINNPDEVRDYFSADPRGYAASYGAPTAVGHSFRVRRERLRELLGRGSGRLLDIGCGPGVMTAEILALGWRYDGVDVAEAMIAEARAKFAAEPRANFFVAKVEAIPQPDATYEAVVAMGLVEYLTDDALALREIARVLRPGGRLLISLPNWWSPVRAWDRSLLVPLARAARRLLGKARPISVRHREYRPAAYLALARQCGFRRGQVVAYNFRILPRPLDSLFPRLAVGSASALERLRRTPLWFLATGVIVELHKV